MLEANDGEPAPEAWEIEEGIPQMHDPVMQKYFSGRDALIEQEETQRSDRPFCEMLSPLAREACAIAAQIRFEEQQTDWKEADSATTSAVPPHEMFPGVMFALGRAKAERTKLFDIVRRMPKGALLHCHLEAMIDTAWLCQEALTIDGIHVASPQPLSTGTVRQQAPFTFRYTKESSNPDANIWSDSYAPGTWVPMTQAADSFPDGGRKGFVSWFKSRTSVTVTESLNHHLGVNDVWKKFLSCFGILKTLIYYEPLYRRFLRRFFEELNADGVRYVEIRAAFMFEYRREGSEKPDDDYDEMIRVLGDEIGKFQATDQGQRFWGARMIWTSIRSMDKRSIVDSKSRISLKGDSALTIIKTCTNASKLKWLTRILLRDMILWATKTPGLLWLSWLPSCSISASSAQKQALTSHSSSMLAKQPRPARTPITIFSTL